MGFGSLFLGYLTAFVLSITVGKLGFGGLALLLGYALMLYGLMELNRYQRAFAIAKWLTLPLMLTALYDLLCALDELFLWQLPIAGGVFETVMQWSVLFLVIVFHLAFLHGIRMLAVEVGLLHIATKAIRNMLLVGLYALIYTAGSIPTVQASAAYPYLTFAVNLLNLVYVICNLLLLISCNKNICPEGDEDQPARPSRFAWVNKMSDAYERNRQKSIQNTTEQVEGYLRRRNERKKRKKKK